MIVCQRKSTNLTPNLKPVSPFSDLFPIKSSCETAYASRQTCCHFEAPKGCWTVLARPVAIPNSLSNRGASPMTIIDSQVHAYEANTPKRPWHSVPNWPDHVTGDEMVAAMNKVSVDGAIFISAFSMYRYDASYAVEVQRAHPGRFAIVK